MLSLAHHIVVKVYCFCGSFWQGRIPELEGTQPLFEIIMKFWHIDVHSKLLIVFTG
jgi:hypothetical protein